MAKGIYERKGKNGDVTYYIRYQFKTTALNGNEIIKDLKEKVGRKSRGLHGRWREKPSKQEKARSRKAGSIWRRSRSPTLSVNCCSVITSTRKATKHRTAASVTRLSDSRNTSPGAIFRTLRLGRWRNGNESGKNKSKIDSESRANGFETHVQDGREVGIDETNPAAGVAPFPVQETRFRYLRKMKFPHCSPRVKNR